MFNIEDVQFIRITCDWWWQRLQNRPRIWDTNKCRYFKQALWIYLSNVGKYKFYEMCDNNDVKFKGTCLNNIPSCYWKLHNLRMKLWVKVSSKASQELDNNNELVCTSAPGWVFKQSCAIKPCRFDHCGNAGKLQPFCVCILNVIFILNLNRIKLLLCALSWLWMSTSNKDKNYERIAATELSSVPFFP